MALRIKSKFLIPTITLIFMGMSLLVLINHFSMTSAFHDTMREDMTLLGDAVLRDMRDDITQKLKAASNLANDFSALRAVQGDGTYDAESFMAFTQKVLNGIESINILDTNGNLVISSSGQEGTSFKDRAYYQKYMSGTRDIISTAITSKTTGTAIVPLVQPIVDARDTVRGAVNIALDLDYLTKSITQTKIGSTGFIFILDKDGTALAHPDKALVMKKDIAETSWGRQILAATDRNILEYDEDGRRRVAVVQKDSLTGWTFVMVTPLEDMLAHLSSATTRSTLIAAICAAAFMVLIWVLVGRVILQPVLACVDFARKVAGGKLDETLRIDRKDEVGELASALRDMVRDLEKGLEEARAQTRIARDETVRANAAVREAEEANLRAEAARREGVLEATRQLEEVIENLTSASEELSVQVEQSSRGTGDQSARTTEAATAMEQMNASVLEVARNASDVANGADMARGRAQDGAQVVERAMQAIFEVHTQTTAMRESLSKLGRQAEDIGAIMNVIDDIADQTNLLALNAAIEAARAGEAGRGFAVVADEVRKLAEKTMNATKEVGQAIKSIQGGTTDNINTMETASQSVDQATTLAEKAGGALKEIVSLIEDTADKVRAIATSSEEQSSASEQISKTFEEINRISVDTAEAMNQSSKAVNQLASLASDIRGLIQRMQR
ncbi:methyl-accepting chemotaxis protein [Desulfocurvibacter africanus]|uniref:methyl-accepting chemotaxis protein n=1 Tax=Desulfocurvibacter africanus TaxID=873 RepID=UPI000419EAD3|nr:methyl-accepting chemotaxis protein [Desulfocurvibacter africanus]